MNIFKFNRACRDTERRWTAHLRLAFANTRTRVGKHQWKIDMRLKTASATIHRADFLLFMTGILELWLRRNARATWVKSWSEKWRQFTTPTCYMKLSMRKLWRLSKMPLMKWIEFYSMALRSIRAIVGAGVRLLLAYYEEITCTFRTRGILERCCAAGMGLLNGCQPTTVPRIRRKGTGLGKRKETSLKAIKRPWSTEYWKALEA